MLAPNPVPRFVILLFTLTASCAHVASPPTTAPTFSLSALADEIDAARFGDAAPSATPGEGKGGIQPGKVRFYSVKKPFRVYRLYSNSNPQGARGRWWTPIVPTGTRDDYRLHYGICTGWNPDLNTVVACDLKAGTQFAFGPGESVNGPADSTLGCANEVYPDDDEHLQIMLVQPVNERVETCEERPMQWQPGDNR